jgi:hypothetical protein
LPVLREPPRASSRRIFPEVVLELSQPRASSTSILPISRSARLITLRALLFLVGRLRPLGRPKPAGVLARTCFCVNILFGDSAGEGDCFGSTFAAEFLCPGLNFSLIYHLLLAITVGSGPKRPITSGLDLLCFCLLHCNVLSCSLKKFSKVVKV